MSEFTEKQISDWEAYEEVRQSGAINMFDARNAAALAGLSRDEYMFCLKNYSALKKMADRTPGGTGQAVHNV